MCVYACVGGWVCACVGGCVHTNMHECITHIYCVYICSYVVIHCIKSGSKYLCVHCLVHSYSHLHTVLPHIMTDLV